MSVSEGWLTLSVGNMGGDRDRCVGGWYGMLDYGGSRGVGGGSGIC